MKKGLKIILGLLVILLILLISGLSALLKQTTKLEQTKIKEIVLKDSNEKDVHFEKIELEFEHGKAIYEVEFTSTKANYKYEIDAKKGTILKKEVQNANVQSNQNEISLEQAKSIALKHASVEMPVSFIKEKQEMEQGKPVYEIEFMSQENKYEYKIHRVSGEIIAYEKENVQSSNNKTTISLDRAKEIVLKHANIEKTSSNISFIKEKQEVEHEKIIYEIEFFYQGKKYEYEIDATTGHILEYEIDR